MAVFVTADEMLAMPDDGQRYELVAGIVRMNPPPGAEHGRIAGRIHGLLFMHAERTGCGVTMTETGFTLASDPDTVRAPDVAFVSAEQVARVGRTARYWPGPPDLAVEVVSPRDGAREVEKKAFAWVAAGTKAVLVLDPARRTATVYRGTGEARTLSEDDTLDLADAVDGFSVRVAELFA